MDWESKYLEKIDRDLEILRTQLNTMEQKLTDNLDRSMARLHVLNRERHQEYLTLNRRIDAMGGKVDRATQWNVKLSVGTFIAVVGLVVALVARAFLYS